MMSADWSPVGGRACLMLSIFTATTVPSDFTGSPVNGDSSCTGLGDGEAGAGGGADDPVSATMSPMASPSAAVPADALIAITRWRLVIYTISPGQTFAPRLLSAVLSRNARAISPSRQGRPAPAPCGRLAGTDGPFGIKEREKSSRTVSWRLSWLMPLQTPAPEPKRLRWPERTAADLWSA